MNPVWHFLNGVPQIGAVNITTLTASSITSPIYTAPAGNMLVQSASGSNLIIDAAGAAAISLRTANTERLLINASGVTTGAGTTAMAPLTITNGTNLTVATANSIENDGAAFYKTQDTTNGRTFWDSWNYFRLTGSGTGITTIADFFGSNDGIPLVANGVYEIEWQCYFTQASAGGIATWTIVTATTALANLNAEYIGCPIAGVGTVGAPQTAAVAATTSSSTALPVTGTQATANHYFTVKAFLTAGNGASNTRLRLTMSAGTATPTINSRFRVRRLSGANVGTFVA